MSQLNITSKDMTEFHSIITMELGNTYINYANKYIYTKKGGKGKPPAIYDSERNEIIVEGIIATANFHLAKNEKDKNKLERYFYTTIANQIKRKSHPKSYLVNFIDDYFDEHFSIPQEESPILACQNMTLKEVDEWLRERLVQGKIVPLDYSIFRARHILNVTVKDIADKLMYCKSFVRGRCKNITDYLKKELNYEINP